MTILKTALAHNIAVGIGQYSFIPYAKEPRGLTPCPECNALSPPFVRFCGECDAPLFREQELEAA